MQTNLELGRGAAAQELGERFHHAGGAAQWRALDVIRNERELDNWAVQVFECVDRKSVV